MKILRFPPRRGAAANLASQVASVESFLLECRTRQSTLREDGRRLKASLDRLSSLAGDLLRSTDSLRRSAGRLRACHGRIGAPDPSS